jgi:hypothetical protein
MKAFLNKHKWTILFWVIFLPTVLYLVPGQSKYYLDKDISTFKTHYLQPILIWTGCVICLGLLLLWTIKTKSIKNSLAAFLTTTLTVAFFLFIFQNLFLAASLFINRRFKQGSVQKIYIANYLAGADQKRENFIPYDLAEKQFSIDEKLISKLYKVGLKQNDSITLTFDKGLLGIAFQSQGFDDK